MLLIIGAAASGKRAYAKSLGYSIQDMLDAATLADELCNYIKSDKEKQSILILEERLCITPVVYNLQELVADLVRKDCCDIEFLVRLFESRDVIIINEVGSGVIPLDPVQTKAREQAGRFNILLAAKASSVIRMVCGIPSVIKEEDESHKPVHEKQTSSISNNPEPCSCFFQNKECAHFPCHGGVDLESFNCLLCYCPLFALGDACEGDFFFTEDGDKDCSSCTIPHQGNDGVKRVAEMYPKLKSLAGR